MRSRLARPRYPTVCAIVATATLAAVLYAISGIWWFAAAATACGALIALLVRHERRNGE